MGARRISVIYGAAIASVLVAWGGASASAQSANVARPAVAPRATARRTSVVYEWAQFGGGLPVRIGGKVVAPAPLGVGPVHRAARVVLGLGGAITQVASSNSDDYALTRGGSVYGWGADAQGELGNGTRMRLSEAPVRVRFPVGVRIVSLPNPMPYDGGMAIDSSGRVWAWGNDLAREFCKRRGAILTTPVKVRLRDVTLAVGALRHALYDAHGQLVSCGAGQLGQLGNGTSGAESSSSRPVAVKGLPSGRVAALTSAWGNAGVLMADGRYFDWGYNADGQVGDGNRRDATTAVRVDLPGPVRSVFQGGSFGNNGQTVALLRNGSLWDWGAGEFGQLGDGRTGDATHPTRLYVGDGERIVSVNSGGSTSYAIDARGRLWAWGNNSLGQLGSGSAGRFRATPVQDPIIVSQVASTAHNVVALASRQEAAGSPQTFSGGRS